MPRGLWRTNSTAQVWEGRNVVSTGRKIIGATNPAASEPGTIRGDFAIEMWVALPAAPTALSPAQPPL